MEQGLVVLTAGMTTVFAFLVLLVLAMNLSSWFFRRYEKHLPEQEAVTSNISEEAELEEIAAAIAVAIKCTGSKKL